MVKVVAGLATAALVFATPVPAQNTEPGTALVRHAPAISGTVEGSVQLLRAEDTEFAGKARITLDLLAPGTPEVRINGKPAYAGTRDGTGAAGPSNHRITLGGNASMRHVVRRTDAVALPVVVAPAPPAGTATLTITSANQPVDWPTVRNLTLSGNSGNYSVPPGAYGDFTANAGNGFVLGLAGSNRPAVYHFQKLTLNGGARLLVAGPVVINLAQSLDSNGSLGSPDRPGWLRLNFHSGGLALNGSGMLWGYVVAPNGSVALGGGSTLVGGVSADRLTVSGNATLRLIADGPPGLPFLAGFEAAEGYSAGALDGQKGWTASSLVIVTDADFAGGARSALLPGGNPPLSLSQSFAPHPAESIVFLDYFGLPFAAAGEVASAQFATTGAMRLALVKVGDKGRVSVFNGNGAGGGGWQGLPGVVPLDPDGYAADWVRFTTRLDFAARKWDLYLNGALAAYDLGFAQAGQETLGAFSLSGHATAPTLLDEFLAAFDNPVFADADKDGMDDAWETAHGLNPALNDRNADPDADTLTNITEFFLGTRPNSADSDADGLSDPDERSFGTNPASADTDGDGLPDGWERSNGFDPLSAADGAADPDGDGLTNLQEYQQGKNPADYFNGVLPEMTSLVGADGELGPDDTIQLLVTNAAGQPLANAPVTFIAQTGGHQLAATLTGPAANEVTVRTGPDGIAKVYVRGGSN